MANKRLGMLSLGMVSILLLFALDLPASAWEISTPEQSLKGLKGVFLVTTGINNALDAAVINKAQLRNEIELKLAANGIRLLPEEVVKVETNVPYLYVNVNAMKAPNELYFYSIKAELKQWVAVFRDKNIVVFTPTWSTEMMGMTGKANVQYIVRKGVMDSIEKFGKAFLAANQPTRYKSYKRYPPY